MTRFEECLKHILKFEGGYVNHPADKGKATNQGITQATLDTWNKERGMPEGDVRYVSQDTVKDIYKTKYWDVCHCDRLLPPLDLVVFDSAVNHGVGKASKLLQEVLGVKVDGVIGRQTLFNLPTNVEVAKVLSEQIIELRTEFYFKIVKTNPTQNVFLKGWMNRLNQLKGMVRRTDNAN